MSGNADLSGPNERKLRKGERREGKTAEKNDMKRRGIVRTYRSS